LFALGYRIKGKRSLSLLEPAFVLPEGKAATKSHPKLPGKSCNRLSPAVSQAQKATQDTYFQEVKKA